MGANEIQAQAQILFAKYGYENTSLSFIAEESYTIPYFRQCENRHTRHFF